VLPQLFLALATLAPSGGDLVLARVGAQAITAADLKERIAMNRSQGGVLPPDKLLGGLVDDYLFAAEGLRLGLDKDPRVVATLDSERRRLASERLLEKEIDPAVKIDEEQLRAMYHGQTDVVHLQLVVAASAADAAAVLERLRKGASLAEEAKGSLDPRSKDRAGDLGKQGRGELDQALAAAAFASPLKTWFGPVPLQLGFAVARVLDRTVGNEAGFAARRGEIEAFASIQARQEMRQHYRQQLRARARVRLDEAFITSTGSRLDATAAELERPIAQVNGRAILYGDVLPAIRDLARGQANSHLSGATVKKEVAWNEIDKILLADDAIARGHGKAPEIERELRTTLRWILARAAADRIREGAPKPSESDIEARYQKDLASLMRPGRRSCAHLLVETRREADDALGRLRKGADFAAMARAVSRDASASRGGDLGEIADDRLEALAKPDQEPALAAALRDARPGEPTGPVRSRAGFHVVRCGPHVAGAPMPLAEVRAPLTVHLAAERGELAVQARLAELRRDGGISIDRAALARADLRDP